MSPTTLPQHWTSNWRSTVMIVQRRGMGLLIVTARSQLTLRIINHWGLISAVGLGSSGQLPFFSPLTTLGGATALLARRRPTKEAPPTSSIRKSSTIPDYAMKESKRTGYEALTYGAGAACSVRTWWWEWVEHRSRRSDPLSKIMEVAGTMVTRWHTVGSPDAAGFRFQMPVCPLLLSAAANIPLPSVSHVWA
jgi:hypothetical protein